MENYQKAYGFDFVHDTQYIFRQLLDATANPGTLRKIEEQANKFHRDCGTLISLGCTVLDNEEIMYVEKNQRLNELLHDLTLCKKGDLTNADYIFLSSEMNYGSLEEIFKNAKRGTYENPHDSATIFILCESIIGNEAVVLEGPGIKDTLEIGLELYVRNSIRVRQQLEIEYPLGVDLVFVTKQGAIMAIPRLCKMKEEA